MTEDLIHGTWGAVKLKGAQITRPLSTARLWHPVCDSCSRRLRWVKGRGDHGFTCVTDGCDLKHKLVEASSQRLPLSKPIDLAMLVSGGNGSGKTELVAQLAVAVATGLDDPDVKIWVEANGIDPSLIPPKGGLVIASSLTSNLSKLTLREKIAKYLPPGSVWRNQYGAGEAEATPINRVGTGKIVFKSNDQGKDKYQGFPAALIILDEEHDYGVYDECLQRLSRFRWTAPDGSGQSGYIVLSMTPLKGLTWVHSEFVEPETRAEGTRVAWLWGENNPHLDQAAREKAINRKSISAAMRAARDRGVFGNAEGIIYREWRRGVHVIKPFKIDFSKPGWYAFEGIDFGDRNPFAYGLYAFDMNDHRLYRIFEHHKAEMALSEHVKIILKAREVFGVDPDKLFTIADPAQKGQRRTLAYNHGIATITASKAVLDGIGACRETLAFTAEREPGFYCFDTCPAFIREIEGYRWLERKVKSDQPDEPLKKNDHAMDEWRYVTKAAEQLAA